MEREKTGRKVGRENRSGLAGERCRGRYRQRRGRNRDRLRGPADIALHKLPQRARLALLARRLPVMAATVSGLVQVERQQHLRAEEAISQKQREDCQRCQGCC